MEPHMFCGTGYAIVTTYENVRRHIDVYAAHQWSYMVLDEAQKIRNPDADVTLACKRIRTFHRLAMSGTPIQNDLRELWSLLDFVFPGRLGTLPTFEEEFAVPIKRGGYSNASPMQVQLAYRCAITLRDLIQPFLLRRLKKDVKEVSRMPGKTEHVLFCRLSQRQRAMYEAYLLSDDVRSVIRRSSGNGGGTQLLAAVTMLRKIANHPDLVLDPTESSLDQFVRSRGSTQARPTNGHSSDDDSDADIALEDTLLERSGKLEVLAKILPLWKRQGHRVLIFCQWRKMLDIIQRFTQLSGWKFGRLDGNTNIASRQRLVDTFNTDESYFGMLCTTRTGGVGLNLIGGE
jgi:DNA excision repair protein ERCC-6